MKSRLVQQLEAELEDCVKRLPRHSIPPNLLYKLEELEAALAEARAAEDDPEGTDADSDDRPRPLRAS